MIQETEFVLGAIGDNWPGGQPDDVIRVNEDKPEILGGQQSGQRERSVDLSRAAVVRAATGDRSRSPSGLEFRYEVETDVEISVEAVHERDHGTVASLREFNGFVRGVRAALNSARQFPEVQYSDGALQPVTYHTLEVSEESTALSEPRQSNYYRHDLTVRLHGKEPTPEDNNT